MIKKLWNKLFKKNGREPDFVTVKEKKPKKKKHRRDKPLGTILSPAQAKRRKMSRIAKMSRREQIRAGKYRRGKGGGKK